MRRRPLLFFLFGTLFLSFGGSLLVLNLFFALFSPPRVAQAHPLPSSQGVPRDATLVISFTKPVQRQEIQHAIFPSVHGEWGFTDPLLGNRMYQTLRFTPALAYEPATTYEVAIMGIKGFGTDKTSSFQFEFQTQSSPSATAPEQEPTLAKEDIKQPPVTLLSIPVDWQDDSLSCEAASLKMALGHKGHLLSEDQIMEVIGYDNPIVSEQGVWGDPHEAYVGKIDGKMCTTGFGVFWGPVAAAARGWAGAESFTRGSVSQLTAEIAAGNPVVVWGTLPVGRLTTCTWETTEGKRITVPRETHVRLLVGFVGPQEHPSQLILNDPLVGRLYWPREFFLKNWEAFGRSGVVIR